jgi:hypothetical protein
MSNKFVSGGIIGPGGETTNEGPPSSSEQQHRQAGGGGANAAEWEAVQKQLEAERRQREEQRVKAATGDEKSLYDILQENKGNVCPASPIMVSLVVLNHRPLP